MCKRMPNLFKSTFSLFFKLVQIVGKLQSNVVRRFDIFQMVLSSCHHFSFASHVCDNARATHFKCIFIVNAENDQTHSNNRFVVSIFIELFLVL